MAGPEFIFLNGQAARVTSLTPDDETGGFTLVVMGRGSADRDQLLKLLNADELSVRLGGGPEQPMRVTSIDVRSSGDGPQAIHRIQANMAPRRDETPGSTPPAPSIEDRLTSLEQRLDRIIELLTDIRGRP
jgi:PAS domain-containing protein